MEAKHGSGQHVAALTDTLSFPLTSTQLRWWFLDQLRPGDSSLNVAVRWELRGNVSRDLIEATFARILERHEILRTRFVENNGTPVQEVLPSIGFHVSSHDLRTLPVVQREKQLEGIAHEMAARPFNLAQPPLLRVNLISLSDERAMLLIVAHHSVFDGYSIGVLGREFGSILNSLMTGAEPNLPTLPLQYGDYALWQEEYLFSDEVREDTEYWKAQLEAMRYFEIAPDFQRPSVRSTRGSSVHVDLPPSFGIRLEQAAKRHDMSSFAFGVGVLSIALQQFTGAKEVVIGSQTAGRDQAELEDLIGVFINNLVLRLPSEPETPIADQLATAKRVVRDALLHQKMPFNKLVEALRPTRDLSRNPLVSINFNLQRNTFMQNKRYDGFELISRPSHTPAVVYDFNFLLIGRPEGWRFTVEYNTDLFKQTTAQRLLDNMLTSFELAFTQPDGGLVGVQRAVAPVRSSPLEPTRSPKDPALHRPTARVTELPRRTPSVASADVPPATALTIDGDSRKNDDLRRLAGIWSDLLGLPAEQCDDDFFRLGGHSLLAMRMLARAEAEFGVKPGIGAFLAEPTLRGFADRLSSVMTKVDTQSSVSRSVSEKTWELTRLRGAEGNGPVIVTINHPIFYYILANSFTQNAVIANLRIPDSAAVMEQSAKTFDEICAEATGEIASVYPGRRIVLLGLCVNGRVALNVAQQLERIGSNVASVVMIDSWAPGTFSHLSRRALWAKKWAIRRRRWIHYFRLRLKGRIGTLELLRKNHLVEEMLRRLKVVQPLSDEELLLGEVTEHLQKLTRDYRYSAYKGDAVLFKSDGSLPGAIETMFGWDSILREDTPVYTVSGWHEDALSNSSIQKVVRIIESRMLIPPSDSRTDSSQRAEVSQNSGERSSAA